MLKTVHAATSDPTVLSENSIDKLRILRRENPSPSVQLIHTWAELLKEQPDEVAKWVRDQHDHESDEQTPIPHHLPTPTSTSPEPFEGQASFEPQCSLSPAGVPDQLFSKPSWKLLSTTELIEAIAVAASQPIQTTRIPSNCEEFDEMFNEYLPKMERIVHQNSQFISKAPCHSDDF